MIQPNDTSLQNFLKDDLSLLLETIHCKDGLVANLSYHQARCTKSRQILFGVEDILDLSSAIIAPKQGLYRCRILYDKIIRSIEYIPYEAKVIRKLCIVPSNIEYSLKYANRTDLDKLKNLCSHSDDILIEQNGYLTDTTIANIAFYDGEIWHTPKYPLLYGTMRQKLIDEGILKEKNIKKSHLLGYKKVALMNAMIGFRILNSLHIEDSKDTHDTYYFSNA